MPFVVANCRAHRFGATFALGLAIAACGPKTAVVADNEVAAVTAATAADSGPRAQAAEGVEPPSASLVELDTVEPGMETPGTEIPDTQAYGQWKVIDAAGSASGRAMIGRTLSFTEENLGWRDASGEVESGCADHVYHIALEAMQVKRAAPAFRPGWAKFRLPPGEVGPMHVWECGDADSIFGSVETGGSVFFPVGTDRLVMNWKDKAVLLLRKESRLPERHPR